MGGAFELSLACHGRVAADGDKVKMALPEVKVGIFPAPAARSACRGCQHAGSAADADLRPDADAAEGQGDGPDPRDRRARQADRDRQGDDQERPEAGRALGREGLQAARRPVYSAAGANLWPPAIAILRRETYGNYPAAAAILKCVYEGLLVPFDTGLRIEQRYFTEIMQTTEAAAMIRSLFVSLQELNKGARRPAGVPETKFKKIGILGAGFMGAGIAYVTAKAGIPVVLVDRDMESAEKGKAHSDGLISDAGQEGPRQAGGEGKAAVADHADGRLRRPRRLRPRRRGGVRGFRGQEDAPPRRPRRC